MNWTIELPTKQGYYGFRDLCNDRKIVFVGIALGIEFITFTGNDGSFSFNDFNDPEWYGPIELPE